MSGVLPTCRRIVKKDLNFNFSALKNKDTRFEEHGFSLIADENILMLIQAN